MDLTQEQLVEKLGNMNVMELVSLTRTLEDKWGVSATAPISLEGYNLCSGCGASVTGPHACPGKSEPEDTDFSVLLTSVGSAKIQVIKVIREITGYGLKEAKELTESLPKTVTVTPLAKVDAEAMKKKLEDVGAIVELQAS